MTSPRLNPVLAATAAALVLSACGSRALTLPDDPIDRAATCGVIAAAQARAAVSDVKEALPFEAQGRVLHFALLGGSDGESFSQDRAAAVNARMSELQEAIVDGEWEGLIEPCREAFPAAASEQVTLPEGREALLGCDELGEFISRAMARQGGDYGNELAEYAGFNRAMDQRSVTASPEERSAALAAIVQAGSPMAVMSECMQRYG